MYPQKKKVILIAVGLLLVAVLVVALFVVLPKLRNGSGEDEIPTMKIDTPYCVLKYPSEWGGLLEVKESTEGGVFAQTYYCNIPGGPYPLFTVSFGDSQRGGLYGYLATKDGKVPIYIECYSLAEDNTLTPSEMEIFYSMMDGINQVIQSIEQYDEFSGN